MTRYPVPAQNFFALLQQVEQDNPGKPPLGSALRLRDEPVRLGQLPHLDFACHDFRGEEILNLAQQGEVRKLYVQNFGLLGPQGALPLHYTEHAFNRQHQSGDRTFPEFLNLFQHRAYLLFYRAWAQSQPHVSFHRPEFNSFTQHLNSLVGTRPDVAETREALPSNFRAGLATHFTRRSRTQEGLASILKICTGLPVNIRPFSPRWIQLGHTTPSRLLGGGAMLGRRSWCAQSKLDVEIGPMAYKDYLHFRRGGRKRIQMFQATYAYIGFELDCDFILHIQSSEVPQCRLAGSAMHFSATPPVDSSAMRPTEASRLGQTAWLGSSRHRRSPGHAFQVRIKCPAVPVQQPFVPTSP